MNILRLTNTSRTIRGTLRLDGSKSISNRALVIQALSGTDPAKGLSNLSTSTDTVTLLRLLRLLTRSLAHPLTPSLAHSLTPSTLVMLAQPFASSQPTSRSSPAPTC